jgi:hypothetical protein
MKHRSFITFCFACLFVHCQENTSKAVDISKYTGKYEANGMTVQVALMDQKLILIVPGAPLQELQSAGANKYTTGFFSDEVFRFVVQNENVVEMVSERGGQSLVMKKTSATPDDFNKNDSLLTLKKSTDHFALLYSKIDSGSIERIADILERDHKKIPADFQINQLPVITVRIYPDLESFHQAINAPGAPKELMATAFGKDDFRMVSPNAAEVDSAILMKGVTHEFTHVVHLNVDYSPNNPRWLWEGVAMYEANWFYDPSQIPGFPDKKFQPLSSLSGGMEYVLGYVIIEAIKDIWGFDTVLKLIKQKGNVEAVLKIDQKKFDDMIYERIYDKYVLKKAN